VTEPIYVYQKGIGWVPTTQSSHRLPWITDNFDFITANALDDLFSQAKKPEYFEQLVDLLGTGVWDKLRALELFQASSLACLDPSCDMCIINFNRGWENLLRYFQGCRLSCCAIARLQDVLNFWNNL
jgi:hypothetical protein